MMGKPRASRCRALYRMAVDAISIRCRLAHGHRGMHEAVHEHMTLRWTE